MEIFERIIYGIFMIPQSMMPTVSAIAWWTLGILGALTGLYSFLPW